MTSTPRIAPAGRTDAPTRRRGPAFALALAAITTLIVTALVIVIALTVGGRAIDGPAAAEEDGGLAVSVGATAAGVSVAGAAADGPLPIDLYLDYTDPASARFSAATSLALQSFAERGAVALALHPVARGTTPSMRDAGRLAGNAVACVGQFAPASLWAFHVALLAAQPADGSTFDAGDLTMLAHDTGASAVPQLDVCIADVQYGDWIDRASSESLHHGVGAAAVPLDRIPTVLVGGELYPGALDDGAAFTAYVEGRLGA